MNAINGVWGVAWFFGEFAEIMLIIALLRSPETFEIKRMDWSGLGLIMVMMIVGFGMSYTHHRALPGADVGKWWLYLLETIWLTKFMLPVWSARAERARRVENPVSVAVSKTRPRWRGVRFFRKTTMLGGMMVVGGIVVLALGTSFVLSLRRLILDM